MELQCLFMTSGCNSIEGVYICHCYVFQLEPVLWAKGRPFFRHARLWAKGLFFINYNFGFTLMGQKCLKLTM